jgi:hypothetical protein
VDGQSKVFFWSRFRLSFRMKFRQNSDGFSFSSLFPVFRLFVCFKNVHRWPQIHFKRWFLWYVGTRQKWRLTEKIGFKRFSEDFCINIYYIDHCLVHSTQYHFGKIQLHAL